MFLVYGVHPMVLDEEAALDGKRNMSMIINGLSDIYETLRFLQKRKLPHKVGLEDRELL